MYGGATWAGGGERVAAGGVGVMGTARIGMCVLLVLYLSMCLCPILPFDLSATQINESYEIWPRDGKASEFFHSLTISLMCFFLFLTRK